MPLWVWTSWCTWRHTLVCTGVLLGVSEYCGDELPDSLYIVRDALLMWAEAIKPHICCLGARWRISENFGKSSLTSTSAILNRLGFRNVDPRRRGNRRDQQNLLLLIRWRQPFAVIYFYFEANADLFRAYASSIHSSWLEWYHGPQGLSLVIYHLAQCLQEKTFKRRYESRFWRHCLVNSYFGSFLMFSFCVWSNVLWLFCVDLLVAQS